MTQLAHFRPGKPAPLDRRDDAPPYAVSHFALPTSAKDRLALSRRIDWRFLLPDPELKHVALVGTDAPLQDALRAFSRALTVFTPETLHEGARSGHAQPFDLVVLMNPSPDALAAAHDLLKPGGCLYAEISQKITAAAARLPRFRRPHSANHLLSVLERHGGWDEIAAHWHWPDFASTTYICPLADLTPAAHRAGSSGARLRSGMLAAVARSATGRKLFASLVSHVSIVARRRDDRPPGGSPDEANPVSRLSRQHTLDHFLRENRTRLGLDRFDLPERITSTLITPRFRASAHVVSLLSRPGCGEPLLVAKCPRLPGAGASLAREAACLRALHARRPGGFDSVPRLVAFEEPGGRALLIETAVSGRHLNARTVRRDPERACRAVVDWLADIDQPAVSADDGSMDRFVRLIDDPFQRLEEFTGTNSPGRRLLDQARLICDRLRPLAIPAVFEHGDLCDPNLFLQDDGRVAVVDWELADPVGLPCADLVFFLAFAACARERARSEPARLRVFRRAFFRRDTWIVPYLRCYLDRHAIPDEAFPALFVLGWTRYLARRLPPAAHGVELGVARTADGVELPPADHGALHENRYFPFWRHAVEHVAELRAHRVHLAGQ